ncbi:50S ribosomal protein L6 [Polystyrenella longa]|uniref:Large ribosomal subunit protein uL6 n=1 Tax=Polystyrenella longa TaxID=2528007 RepID=A0A518CR92_9PLAN|nr:50S ribosomal protein L6 [Polystyrenella longa]QDU81735.1 50S ribosomal protein L6 [Polystyrenella longa]
MSRIGKKPIAVNDGVDVNIKEGTITVKGKNGSLDFTWHPNMNVAYDSDKQEIAVTRPNDQRQNRALHGLTRSLIGNMVQGVQELFERKLEIKGVGYNGTIQGNVLRLQVGFANTIELPIPEGVNCQCVDPTHITITSADKQKAGQFAANIRKVRPPEPYKGKGIRYEGEFVRIKAGKALAGK